MLMETLSTASSEEHTGRAGDTVQALAECLRQKILSGELRAGERIRESTIAGFLNVSRAPLREALRLIEHSGLIEKTPNRSYVVVTFNDHDIYELATLRTALEILAARLALQRAQTAPALEAAIQVLKMAVQSRDLKAIAASDRRFHEVLVECANHKRLLISYRGLRDQIELAMLNVQRDETNIARIAERHSKLVAMVGRPDAFIEELSRHIREGMGIADISSLGE